MRPWLAALAATSFACSPYGNGVFTCTDNASCAPDGICQPGGQCSFPDTTCASGQRYGGNQGSVSNTCVGELPIDAPPIDMPIDDPPAIDASCIIGGLDLCSLTPQAPLIVNALDTLDTDTDARCQTLTQSGGPDACLVYTTNVIINATGKLRATGARPLIIASQFDITISGQIDAGSFRNGGGTGAGANGPGCTFTGNPDNDAGGAGGGAGGTFHGKGGNGGGGDSDNSNNPKDGPSSGGTAPNGTGTPPDFVRGGCPGQRGGNNGGSNGGASGGGVWLFANGTIDVRPGAGVRATGAGANGGLQANAGAGGGGSGGYIKLVATSLVVNGTLAANGGGGGEGGNGVSSGDFGGDGNFSATAAGGGNSAASGGNGGNGSAGGSTDGAAANSQATSGGGGGGGAAGFIVLVGTLSGTGIISPGSSG